MNQRKIWGVLICELRVRFNDCPSFVNLILTIKNTIIMGHENEHSHCHYGVKLGLKIAKVVLSAATVAVGVCMVKEIHKVHRAIEKHEHRKLL